MVFKQPEQTETFGYDDFADLSGTFVKLQIHYVADFLTISDINDFFFLKI
jgi:hypothetical protein